MQWRHNDTISFFFFSRSVLETRPEESRHNRRMSPLGSARLTTRSRWLIFWFPSTRCCKTPFSFLFFHSFGCLYLFPSRIYVCVRVSQYQSYSKSTSFAIFSCVLRDTSSLEQTPSRSRSLDSERLHSTKTSFFFFFCFPVSFSFVYFYLLPSQKMQVASHGRRSSYKFLMSQHANTMEAPKGVYI